MDHGYIVHSVMGHHSQSNKWRFFGYDKLILRVEDGEIKGALKQAGVSGNLFKAISNGVHLGMPSSNRGVSIAGGNHLSDILFSQGVRINPA